ncbi:MAG: tetratricopeptide repeat-containing sensor histidine kinase [Chitinophagaceae bacterium]
MTSFDQYKKLFLGTCFLLMPFLVFSQHKIIDSLLLLLQNARLDSTKINLNYKLAEQLTGYDLKRSDKYLEEGYKLAKARNDSYSIAYYFLNKGEILFDLAKYNEANSYFDSAIVLFDDLINSKEKDRTKIVTYKFAKTDCLTGKGLLAAKLYHYQESIQYYLQAIAGIENMEGKGKNSYMATLYADLASDYYELEQFENALEYDKKALPYLDKDDNIDLYIIGNLFVADDYSGLSMFDSSSVYIEKVRPIVMQLNKPGLNVRFYYILGGIYRKKKEWNNALVSFKKANEAAREMKDVFQLLNSEEGMASCYMQIGNLVKARELALSVFNESNRVNVPLGKVQSLQLLTEIEEKSGNIDKAYQYQKQWMQVSDSMKKEKVQRQMNETEAKYQNEKKQNEILQLQKSNALQSLSLQKKSAFNYFLIGSVSVLMITGFLGYRNFRNRQQLAKQQDELQQQRIRELEKDKQLIAVDSLLKGQEEERSRLAKDLHDGLGGLLSGVKFSLSNMKDNLIITPDNMAVFERSLDMLDTSIKELRRVAHNMMPEMLTKFGLDEALKEYCNTVNATKLLAVKYQSLGMETRLDESTEIVVYRIVQELLNNVLKHGAASEAFLQLIREDNRLNIVVEDNGKGFDTALLENSKGAGWVNIRSRVEYLKGKLDIHSEPGKGTLVNMEFNV